MNILAETKAAIEPLGIPIETGVFKSAAPDTYIVLVPLLDDFALSADNLPQAEVQELRISLFSKGNYIKTKNQITAALLRADITVTERRYNGYDTGAGYHQYSIDVAKNYEVTED